jgi:hypothetical protein
MTTGFSNITPARTMLLSAGMEILAAMVALLILAIAVLPGWPYSPEWGYYPTGICGLVVVVIATMIVVGRL